jgi:curved DNA-binding protein CbpA
VSADVPPHPRRGDLVRGLYRALIKLCHPDLASSDADRMRREEFTARVNAAYAARSAAWLAELAREWEAGGPGAVGGSGTAKPSGQPPELRSVVGLIRRHLGEARAEISRLTAAGLEELLLRADDPHAVVQRLAAQVRAEIQRQRDVLRRLRSQI